MTAPTQQEAIAMAREAGLSNAFSYMKKPGDGLWANGFEWTEEIHTLVAAAYARGVADEREGCAITVRKLAGSEWITVNAALSACDAIRNRSKP